ncbi:hypothetical protein Hanom_Chr12g01129381 [Helianthus anomalus]
MDLTEKLTDIHSMDYPSNKLSNHREHRCNFLKLGIIGVILQNHKDHLCILLYIDIDMFDD